MNTLSKEITLSILGEGGYERLTAFWSAKVREGVSFRADQHLLYAALRGKDWRKGFTAPSEKKRANGHRPAVEAAYGYILSTYRDEAIRKTFEDCRLKEGWLERLRHYLPKRLSGDAYTPQEAKMAA